MSQEATLTTGNNDISSITVVEPLPRLSITLSRAERLPTVLVDGMPTSKALEIPWGDIAKKLLELTGILGGGKDGGAGGGSGCTTVKITNADGSSTSITQCPAPKAT